MMSKHVNWPNDLWNRNANNKTGNSQYCDIVKAFDPVVLECILQNCYSWFSFMTQNGKGFGSYVIIIFNYVIAICTLKL